MSRKPEAVLNMAVRSAEDKKAHNLVVLDLKGVSLIADYYVICHGNSDTQVQAIATDIRKQAHERGVPIKGIEGFDSARWVLVDLGDVVIHVFHRDEREYYNIERLWSDAKVVENV
ncbi:ribosome silencing factor [Paenibacillus koleovorans]|uniref:ribosome silencing factor n=1 Tax=Paenibacillus koleovorans TaxID=121608 RepID=UPI000FD756B3|nr:ribosome silencing factor [Paenibacillus koleovorans]